MKRFLLVVVLLTFVSVAHAQFSFAPINVPNAVATVARGINNNGEIVGYFKSTNCADLDIKVPNCTTHGFKYVNGSFVKLMVPNSVSTAILGVNDYGDLVGFYKKSDGTRHGFIWLHTNVIKTIAFPGTSSVTVPFGINKSGTVVGGLWAMSSSGSFPNGGWVWVNGTFSNMDPHSGGGVAPCCWSVNGIANTGVISGQLFQSDFNMAWFKRATDEDFFMKFPSGNTGGDTFGLGVNAKADMVGYSPGVGGWFAKTIEANETSPESGEPKISFVTVKFPNSQSTVPFGLNYARGVVGEYVDSSGKMHGFLAKASF